jgi:hypothetical protein
MKGWRLVVAVAAVTTSIVMPRLAVAEDPYPESAGWGVLAVLVNVGYMPVKTVYATIGGVTGGLAYACTGGGYDTASDIWQASLGGTYVLTPSMIRGETPIAFAGDSSADAASSETSSETTTVEQPTQRSHRGEEGLPPS